MGKSAKLHKRIPKKVKSSASPTANPVTLTASSSRSQVETAKKRSTLKQKGSKSDSFSRTGKGVLGDADYVSLLMGNRKKVREEAQKLPQDSL
ncbi:hypothetical protein HYPSUDRAFT_42329 [Hypholoma sublateritium FD-334 SS-4]|uniref:Uncharacterized protein n=1 Tax=Hypholoma sublateritium (strain FD-334 SS-4) TaxID=945553 RepID=A0A0D2NR27_HYPSF|nr:hypothetical protein HYPSUDRAFT_42329 [Hypholoma sublateritium FD-334 SS-4]